LNKHPGDDAPLLALNRPDDFPLSLKDRSHIGREGKFAALAILRLARVEAQPTLGLDVQHLDLGTRRDFSRARAELNARLNTANS
jgi:hypothetical protein